MPNKTGGKNYKKSKHGGAEAAVVYIDRQEGQQYGRVIRVLGNGNMLVYCNDGEQRICHIRGAIRKRVWINLGDVVLVSLRDFGAEEDRGDILAKIDPKAYSKVKKEAGVNPVLFNNLEGGGGAAAAAEDGAGDDIEFETDAPAAGGAGAAAAADADADIDIDDI